MLEGVNIRDAITYLIALILSVCVHEFGHAFVADRLGDPVPRGQGRVTLNPVAHIDPIGTLVMPLVGFFSGLPVLGWGKPVQISLSARSMTRRWSIKLSHLFIAVAGPSMNIIFALVLSPVYVGLIHFGVVQLAVPVAFVIRMNIGLAFFNLIPCPPLDGGAILRGLLPRDLEFISDTLERYGFIILLALLMTHALSVLMRPAMWLAASWLDLLTGLVR